MISLRPENEKQKSLLSVVIPAYNEEKRLAATLEKIVEYLCANEYQYEIIVVDDGSTDRTVKTVKEALKKFGNIRLILNDVNKGKGYSVKRGIMEAKGNYVIFSDADLSTPIEETENMLKWIYDGYDIAVASRGLKESEVRVHQPFYREYMGKTFNLLVRLFVFGGIRDTQCGFKCFRGEVIQEIFRRQKIDRFSFDVEILYIAKKMGCSIKEVPVQWFNEPDSRVNPLNDSTRMFLDLLKIRYYDLRGAYGQKTISLHREQI